MSKRRPKHAHHASPNRTKAQMLLVSVIAFVLGSALAGGVAVAQQMLEGSTPTISSDKPDYAPGEQVTLTGTGWADGEGVHIVVNDTNGQTWTHTADVTAASDGTLSDVFNLPDYFVSNYDVTATGPVSGTATTTFTDLSIGTYDQCSNNLGDGYTTGDTGCRWINGNLQGNNSRYPEGDATVQRLWLTDLPTGTHTITLQYGTTKSGKHAYDFLTTWSFSENWITNPDLCQDVTIPGCTASTGAPPLADTLLIPDDSATPTDGAAGAQFFTMYNGDMQSATNPAIVSGTYAGDSETQITITFTVDTATCLKAPNKTQCDVTLWFGAHVASQLAPPLGWGVGNGAGNISGSPYHVSLAKLDGASIGSRDNQMQASAVTPNGTIVIVKDAIPNDAQDFSFNLTGGLINQNFSLDDDGDNTDNPPSQLSNTRTFSVPPGGYTASELGPLPAGWTLTNLVCVDPTNNTTVNIGTRIATINLASNETVTCTYTDTLSVTPTVTTEIHNDDVHTGVTSVPLGSTVHDSATVTGSAGTPTGIVTFDFFNNGTCTNPPAFTSGNFGLSGGTVDATSFAQGPLAAGSYSFKAHYAGAGPYTAANSDCEPLTVGKANTTLTTDIHDADHNVVTSVALGSTVHDSASLAGKVDAIEPTGNVSFTFYANGDCTGDGTAAGSVALVNGVAHPSDAFGPLAAGSYSFSASYPGDDNYNGDASPCEPLTVNKENTTTTTAVHLGDDHSTDVQGTEIPFNSTVHDSATVTDNGAGIPTGNVSFTFYTNGTCSGDGTASGTVALDAFGVADPSTAQGPLAAGSYSFKATYEGDANYNGSTSGCEPFTVKPEVKSQITPTQTTCASFRDGTSATLAALDYSVKNGTISQVAPGVFFYWIDVTATVTGPNTFVIDQNNDQATFNHFFNVASGSNVFTTNCTRVAGNTITQGTGLNADKTTITFNGTIGTHYIIGVKYDSGSVKGFSAPNPTTVNYTFETLGILGSTEGIALQLKT